MLVFQLLLSMTASSQEEELDFHFITLVPTHCGEHNNCIPFFLNDTINNSHGGTSELSMCVHLLPPSMVHMHMIKKEREEGRQHGSYI